MAGVLCHTHSSERHGTAVLQFPVHKHTSAGVLRYKFLFLFIIHVCLALLKVRVGILFYIHSLESTRYVIYSPHI